MRALALVVLAACSSSKQLDETKTRGVFTEVVVDTAPGLSGLAADPEGRLWTVAERDHRAYRITLSPLQLETFTVTGADGVDLEGIEQLGPTTFAFGTEGREPNQATVLLGELRGSQIAVTQTITLSADQVGMQMKPNHGAEGICGAGSTIIAAIEGAAEDNGKRWAPVVRIVDGAFVRAYRVALTSPTGKLSALDCVIAADGTIEAWAIERHFEVTRILQFTLPPDAAPSLIQPRIALDIGSLIDSKRNLEGIAQLPDGRIVTVSDNQWRTIEGPSTLQVFSAGAVK